MPFVIGPLEWLIIQAVPFLILFMLIAIFVRMGRNKKGPPQ